MAERRPIVLVGGRQKELPTGDTLPTMKLYPKTYVDTASGTFTLPATALPDVDVLAIGGGSSGGIAIAQRGAGGTTTVQDSLGQTIVEAEGALSARPGRGGGIGARHSGGSASGPGHPGTMGVFGFSCGGAAFPWSAAGSGDFTSPGAPGTGDGGGSGQTAANASSVGGNGGGVFRARATIQPGSTCTHTIGAGGVRTGGNIGEPGGSGRVEYHYLDTVP